MSQKEATLFKNQIFLTIALVFVGIACALFVYNSAFSTSGYAVSQTQPNTITFEITEVSLPPTHEPIPTLWIHTSNTALIFDSTNLTRRENNIPWQIPTNDIWIHYESDNTYSVYYSDGQTRALAGYAVADPAQTYHVPLGRIARPRTTNFPVNLEFYSEQEGKINLAFTSELYPDLITTWKVGNARIKALGRNSGQAEPSEIKLDDKLVGASRTLVRTSDGLKVQNSAEHSINDALVIELE